MVDIERTHECLMCTKVTNSEIFEYDFEKGGESLSSIYANICSKCVYHIVFSYFFFHHQIPHFCKNYGDPTKTKQVTRAFEEFLEYHDACGGHIQSNSLREFLETLLVGNEKTCFSEELQTIFNAENINEEDIETLQEVLMKLKACLSNPA